MTVRPARDKDGPGPAQAILDKKGKPHEKKSLAALFFIFHKNPSGKPSGTVLTVLFERPIRKPCGMVLQDLLSTSSGMVPGKQGPENRLCGPAEWFLVSRDRRTVPVVPLVP